MAKTEWVRGSSRNRGYYRRPPDRGGRRGSRGPAIAVVVGGVLTVGVAAPAVEGAFGEAGATRPPAVSGPAVQAEARLVRLDVNLGRVAVRFADDGRLAFRVVGHERLWSVSLDVTNGAAHAVQLLGHQQFLVTTDGKKHQGTGAIITIAAKLSKAVTLTFTAPKGATPASVTLNVAGHTVDVKVTVPSVPTRT